MTAAPPRLRYDPGLLEAAVEHVLRQRREDGDVGTAQRYRRAADRIYLLHQDPEDRRAAFTALHARLFEELGCARPVAAAAGAFAGRIEEVLVARAWSEAEEGAELSAGGRTLGLRLRPGRFTAPAALEGFLRHETVHVRDMLDPAFGYGRRAEEFGGGMRRLVGERFGLLWDCTIDGRIARTGVLPLHTQRELEEGCSRLFPEVPREVATEAVHRLWEGERPTYAFLLLMAADPSALAEWGGHRLEDGSLPEHEGGRPAARPGVPCPLCGFPTYDWAPSIDAPVAALIAADAPAWRLRDGACARCAEAYALRVTPVG